MINMQKNNKKVSQRGLKRDAKNKARLKRVKAHKEFHANVNYVKLAQDSMPYLFEQKLSETGEK